MTQTDLAVDPGSRVAAVLERLVTAIATGQYLPGSRLPAERDLAAVLGAGRTTVRAALAQLAERGLVETRRGRHGGTFVLQQWPESSTEIVGRTLSASLLGRLPYTAIGLLMILRVRETGGGYAEGGAAAGAFAVGLSLLGPFVGRLVDRHGQRAVLLPCC